MAETDYGKMWLLVTPGRNNSGALHCECQVLRGKTFTIYFALMLMIGKGSPFFYPYGTEYNNSSVLYE